MKALEKELIYNLLKTASDNYYGYSSPDFTEKPVFSDDIPSNNFNSNSDTRNITLDSLNQKILGCSKCSLSKQKTNIIPGQGVSNPEVLVLGENPSEEDDQLGQPFTGEAGKLLDKMLAAIQLGRNCNCYLSNTVKCHPPYNREADKNERESCKSYLDAQIHLLKPKMILALGKTVLSTILNINEDFSLNKYRGQILNYNNIPLVVTYHPNALLRNIEFKKPAWEDLKFFRTKLLELSPDYAKDFQPK